MTGLLKTPKAPEPEPVTEAPDETEIAKARKRESARSRKRGGRASTVLTDGNGQGLGG
tara:strand:- start:14818 stop:14991 length:174 start_codon:yes stop_codon:yes gene_type:complete